MFMTSTKNWHIFRTRQLGMQQKQHNGHCSCARVVKSVPSFMLLLWIVDHVMLFLLPERSQELQHLL